MGVSKTRIQGQGQGQGQIFHNLHQLWIMITISLDIKKMTKISVKTAKYRSCTNFFSISTPISAY